MIFSEKPIPSVEVGAYYDELDPFYRDSWGDQLHHGLWEKGNETTDEAIAHLRETIAEGTGATGGQRVCDIGCGYGTAALYWAETRQWETVGVTVSSKQQETALNRAQALTKGIPRPEFLLCDWLDNDFRDESFDAATSIECLSHVTDKEGFFREVERTLKPGGQLSLSAWSSGKKTSTRRAKFLLEPICAGGQFPSLLGSGEIRSLAESAGLVVEELREVGPMVKKTWRIIIWRLLTRLLTRREYRRFLGKDARNGWLRTLTVLRVWIAFELGVLDYALLRAKKRAS